MTDGLEGITRRFGHCHERNKEKYERIHLKNPLFLPQSLNPDDVFLH